MAISQSATAPTRAETATDSAARPAAETHEAKAEQARAVVSLPQFLLAYVYIGGTSIGGRSASYLLQELVQRRKWLQREDWLEGMALGLMLPGMVGNSCAMFLANLLRGPRAAVLALFLYSIPGFAIALALSILVFSSGRPPWADEAIRALSASAFGLFLTIAARNIPATRKTLLGPLVAAVVFVTYGLLGVGLLPVLLAAGVTSFASNEGMKAWRRTHER